MFLKIKIAESVMEFVEAFASVLFGAAVGYFMISMLVVLCCFLFKIAPLWRGGVKSYVKDVTINFTLFDSWWWGVFWVIYSSTFALLYLMKGDTIWMGVHVVWLLLAIVLLFEESLPDVSEKT